jgi:CheY-like chemotaxis protein
MKKIDDSGSEMPMAPDALRGKKILIVEDSPDNRLIVKIFLQHAGAEVLEAENGIVALQIIEKNEFDLVIMDIQMPELDGYQTMIRLKKADYKVPVIALTANALQEERDRCLLAGFRNYVTKPVKRDSLLKSVGELL